MSEWVKSLRWRLWVAFDVLSFRMCPDKKALLLVRRYGYEKAKWALEESRREREANEAR